MQQVDSLERDQAQQEQAGLPPQEGVVDVTDYPDMQELMAATDALVTDHSSCIYDFMLTRRPGFIYARDLQTMGIVC